MKGKKIIIISIILNILTIGVIYNFIEKDYLNNEKILVKAMTENEYENSVKSLNTSHEDFVNYIKESKTKIANAITDMGVETSEQADLDTMATNIRSIVSNIDGFFDNKSSIYTLDASAETVRTYATTKAYEKLLVCSIVHDGTNYIWSRISNDKDIPFDEIYSFSYKPGSGGRNIELVIGMYHNVPENTTISFDVRYTHHLRIFEL